MLYALITIAVAVELFEIGIGNRRRIFRIRAKEILGACYQSQRYAALSVLSELPGPVANYLTKALPEDLAVIRTMRLRHEGYFRTGPDKNWERIRGEQYFAGTQPGFAWKGSTRMFTAIDSYVAGKGNLSIWLFSVLRIVDRRGSDIDDAEIIRWLAECVLVPSNLLPSENLKWEAVDSAAAKLQLAHKDKVFELLACFNTHNEIESVETERPFNEKSSYRWIGRFRNYKNIEGYRVPTELEAIWNIDGAEKPYARFSITQMNFNRADLF